MNKELILPSLKCEESNFEYMYLRVYSQVSYEKLIDFSREQGCLAFAVDYPSSIVAIFADRWNDFHDSFIEESVDLAYEKVSKQQLIAEDEMWELILTQFNIEFIHSNEFFHIWNAFHCVSGLKFYEESCCNSYIKYQSLCPDAFITFQYPHRVQKVDNAFVKWYKALPQLYEIHKLTKEFSPHGHNETLPGTAVHITNCTCNLQFILEFCWYALNSNAEFGWSANELKLVVDMFDILNKYQYISMISQFFISWHDELNFYYQERDVAISLLEKRKIQVNSI